MTPLGLSVMALALDLNYPFALMVALLDRRRAMDADLALKLGARFDMTSEFWIQMQNNFEQYAVQNQTHVFEYDNTAETV
ncbi:MAG: hypothetical protein K2X57_29060 [Xanthobacteraceae bacterium]|nr:hypothetical protein [Xanthobacteraceae bacterium]